VAIFNQDRAAVLAGATFEVVIPPASESLVHRAEPDNTFGDTSYLDDPLTNGSPGISVSVTQNWNPGGGGGVYNDHPVGLFYDEDEDRWAVYNLDEARMPEGAAFNIAVSKSAESMRWHRHGPSCGAVSSEKHQRTKVGQFTFHGVLTLSPVRSVFLGHCRPPRHGSVAQASL